MESETVGYGKSKTSSVGLQYRRRGARAKSHGNKGEDLISDPKLRLAYREKGLTADPFGMSRSKVPGEQQSRMANNRISTEKRVFILAALSEGTPINAVCRMLRVGKHAVLRVIEETGAALGD